MAHNVRVAHLARIPPVAYFASGEEGANIMIDVDLLVSQYNQEIDTAFCSNKTSRICTWGILQSDWSFCLNNGEEKVSRILLKLH